MRIHMENRKFLRLGQHAGTFFLVLFGISVCFKSIPAASAADILLLNSYHQGDLWTDDITRGVYSAFSQLPNAHTIYTEQMDAMRFPGKRHRKRLTQRLRSKYQGFSFKAVIASDDIALDYLIRFRDTLFPKTPIVFCGADFIEENDLQNLRGVIGINETASLEKTVALILRLHPDTQRIAVISDRTPAGVKLSRKILEFIRPTHELITFIFFEDLSPPGLIHRISQLSQGDVLLYLTLQTDEKAPRAEKIRTFQAISKRCRIPIYGIRDDYLGHGIVGGHLVNGFAQGQAAAQLTLKILNGERVEDLPGISQSPNRYMFDYNEMRRFSIEPDQLPEESTIVNRPNSIYTQHKTVITAFLGGIIGLHFIIFSLVLNILKRRRAEAVVLKNQRRFNTIMETAKEGFIEIDPKAVVQDVNPEMCAMIGRQRREIVGRSVAAFLTPASADQLRQHLQLTLAGTRCSFEITITRHDQKRIACLFNMSPFLDEMQTGIGCFAMVSDVTELKIAESALQKSEETLRATFESTEDGLLVVAQDGNVTHLNTKFMHMWNLAFPSGELNDSRKLLQYIKEGLERPEESDTKIGRLPLAPAKSLETLKLRNGRTLERFSCPLIIEEREAGRVWIFRDITEKKELESQLLQAQKMEAIGNLAGGIAHDFNNRLQTISGYAQLLLHDKDRSESDATKLTAIERSVRSSGELIDQLLMFSRKITSKLTPTDLNHEVRHIRKLLERTIPRMIRINLKLADDLGIINADPPQIEQVLMNLSINASHAMPAGGTLTIVTENVLLDSTFCKQNLGATPGKFVRLRVRDSGMGMTKEILDHIYEPFFTTKSPGKGTGLGLAMVHGIIKNHNGYIACSSILNQGSCFDLYFPILSMDIDTMTLHVTTESNMVGGMETILLVEDDAENLDVGRSMLERFGYTVLTAADHEEALAEFTKAIEIIDLTILDLNMPGTGGQSILKAILAMAPSARILIASGFSGLAVKHALAAGAAGYIRKPYRMADLLLQVRRMIDTPPHPDKSIERDGRQ